jgi:hypothetical protein
VTYSDVQGGWSGTGNINSDPKFFDDDGDDGNVGTPDDNLRLWCTSLCVDAGDNNSTIVDTFDIDNDGLDDEDTPDRDWKDRILNAVVDMGAYERFTCQGDVNQDGLIDVNDLLAVVNSWGTCGTPTFCPADVADGFSGGGQCDGDGVVDVNDLLAVINTWGLTVCDSGRDPIYATMPQSLQDCWDDCSEKSGEDLGAFLDCYEGCAEALCIAEIILCD